MNKRWSIRSISISVKMTKMPSMMSKGQQKKKLNKITLNN